MAPHGISRRDMLRTAALGSLSLVNVKRALGQTPRRPNIVFIMADDLGYADVSCYGRPDLTTPNIDRIAAQRRALSAGLREFRRLLGDASRRSITGRYQYRLRVGLEEPLGSRSATSGLPPEHPTLPSLLQKAGYGTTLVGKWHLGCLPKFGPLKSGYDHFYGFRGGARRLLPHTPAPDQKPDLWDDDVPVQQIGLSDGAARRPRRRRRQRLREITPAVPPEPALQRAALAVGSARRRGGVGAAAHRRT